MKIRFPSRFRRCPKRMFQSRSAVRPDDFLPSDVAPDPQNPTVVYNRRAELIRQVLPFVWKHFRQPYGRIGKDYGSG